MNKKSSLRQPDEIVSLNRELASFGGPSPSEEEIERILEKVASGAGTCGTNDCQVNTVTKCNNNTCTDINTCGSNN